MFHPLWNENRFKGDVPDPPPLLTIKVTIMHQTHASFWTHPDPRAQTGPKILKLFRCSEKYLVPTNHRIRDITDNKLDIKGVFSMHIRIGSRETQ